MGRFVVLGAGAVGQGTARELAGAGHEVQVVSRSGRGPQVAGVTAVAADAGDVDRLTTLASGASAIVNALNPPKYTTWEKDWPPLAAAALTAAERTGAGLVTVNNLYAYGQVDGPMTETTPLQPNGHKGALRARMWKAALEAHRAGRVRASELRASDYTGPGVGAQSLLNSMVVSPALRGRPVWLVMGGPDVPHTWTDVRDTARLAAVLATDDRSWGQAWHVPSAEPRTVREVVADVARVCGRAPKAVHGIPRGLVTALGAVVPLMRELRETRHQFERPFVLDSSHTQGIFGLRPTPWEQTVKETVDYLSATAA
ncbi:NAD-dependent epimerase/dehydratase family protein [Knoellia sp. p5-6-4]|uniref:NAD-dependent epimerase/dehydratase family protein n=1 Tax=unclassified Knoellia TaxID=2618719 RepID=UPI0023DAB4F4|nr:NAD-dependent epimerase/dehydratase family protein [Knoellia sp. p5-6-4]MDF2145097.1 NAD(P)H-binding protein [Knoellia sp. p5-6-4]